MFFLGPIDIKHQTSKSWPNFSLKDLTKIQLQNFRFNFSLKILTKIQLQNLFKTSKSWPNLKVLTKNIPENLDQTSASITWPKFRFKIFTQPQLQNLDQTVVNMFLSTNTNNTKKFWVGTFKGQSHTSQVYQTAVSQSVNDKGRQWSELGPTIRWLCM